MQVRLTQKLANRLDGVDVSSVHVGDVIELSDIEAATLIAEGWAEPADEPVPSPVLNDAKPLSAS